MSKSTPLSQLPQSTSTNDMDNDPLVQEVLSELAQSNGNGSEIVQETQTFIPQMPPQQMYNGSPHVAPDEFITTPPPPQNFNAYQNAPVEKKTFNFDSDMKQVLIVIAIVFLVQVVPIEQYVYKYIAIENIPYSAVLIKAVVAGALFVLGMKYLM